MHINEALDTFWQEHGKNATRVQVPDIRLEKMVNAEKHPVYGWETPSAWFSKMVRQERENGYGNY